MSSTGVIDWCNGPLVILTGVDVGPVDVVKGAPLNLESIASSGNRVPTWIPVHFHAVKETFIDLHCFALVSFDFIDFHGF